MQQKGVLFPRKAPLLPYDSEKIYKKALAEGDKNVYFINGKTFFGKDLYSCTVDSIHPNDLGFYFMAKKLIPVIKKALKQKQDKT